MNPFQKAITKNLCNDANCPACNQIREAIGIKPLEPGNQETQPKSPVEQSAEKLAAQNERQEAESSLNKFVEELRAKGFDVHVVRDEDQMAGNFGAVEGWGLGQPESISALNILDNAKAHMEERASEYDKPEGERSVPAIVAAFNAITGHNMTEAEGWLFLQLLKQVRLFSASGFHQDSAEDNVAYGALLAEAKAREQ